MWQIMLAEDHKQHSADLDQMAPNMREYIGADWSGSALTTVYSGIAIWVLRIIMVSQHVFCT